MVTEIRLTSPIAGVELSLVPGRRMWTDVVRRELATSLNDPQPQDLHGADEQIMLSIVDAASPELEATLRALTREGTKVLVYGGILHSSKVLSLVRQGASGYLTEIAHRAELVSAILRIARGEVVLPFEIPDALVDRTPQLTPAESRAAQAYFIEAIDLSRKEVASSLGISESTLRNQLEAARKKLGATPDDSRAAVSRRLKELSPQENRTP